MFTLNVKQCKMPGGENDVPTAISDQHKLYFTKYCTSNWSETRALLKKSYRIVLGLVWSDRFFRREKTRAIVVLTQWRKEKNIHHFAAVIARRYHMYAYKFEINKYLFISMPHLPTFARVCMFCLHRHICTKKAQTVINNSVFGCIHYSCIFFALFIQCGKKKKRAWNKNKTQTMHKIIASTWLVWLIATWWEWTFRFLVKRIIKLSEEKIRHVFSVHFEI